MKPLDRRERLFVDEYLTDLDPKRAAISAGYSSTVAASKAYQWVSNSKVKPHVFAAIEAAQKAISEKLGVTTERVLAEYAKLGFADIRDVVSWRLNSDQVLMNQDGEEVTCPENIIELKPSAEIDDDAAAAISEVSMSKDGTLKVKMHDKKGALDSIGKHLGMFIERIGGPDGGPVQVKGLDLSGLSKDERSALRGILSRRTRKS